MSNKQRIKEALTENPFATNKEISERLDINESSVSKTISRLKEKDEAVVENVDGKRHITIIETADDILKDFKKNSLIELAEQLISANENETNSYELRQNGALLVRILEKI
ncbi:winged helix-turn-helix transcriptional regulator [Lactobacillus terrae]|uniref:winged helix-turn-helix transcriptional regulator n=1 Tax=Lactobacillus terrae TaxID=2269374 RepID=UPI000C1B715A|nr:winged helix-turn-helix transcriptional regulator [Lactobacillus terrae]